MHALFGQSKRRLASDLSLLEKHIPLFLCPALSSPVAHPLHFRFRQSQDQSRKRTIRTFGAKRSIAEANSEPLHSPQSQSTPREYRELPASCPGCGAPTQTESPGEAGYYKFSRKAVKAYTKPLGSGPTTKEDEIFQTALKSADQSLIADLGLSDQVAELNNPTPVELEAPLCDRCHKLINHREGQPIFHPSILSIHDMIAESPHEHNHVYHVLDAVDFPMSLIPNLQRTLKLSPMRTQNRRAKHHHWLHGRYAEVSFIITRSDLLAPRKEQVDALMPYMTDVLRDTLGKTGKNYRLGNVHLVSSKRGWWTKEVKETIWNRGGAGWMVGKANVGKSNLFEAVFPKGRSRDSEYNLDKLRHEAAIQNLKGTLGQHDPDSAVPATNESNPIPDPSAFEEDYETIHDPTSLLPPPQKETAYPVMPVVSDLPGTTAAPIRVPFGKGKGELIDLPGLERSTLEKYVKPEHRLDIIMKNRQEPEKAVIKPGQSLLLGGLIRITPTTPDLIYIAHPFVTLKPHVTSNEKAAAIHAKQSDIAVPTITEEWAGEHMRSAGTYDLSWDVTKQQTGTLTARDAGKRKTAELPFVVYSTDIVIEGVGWVEVTCQVRRRHFERLATKKTWGTWDGDSENPFEEPKTITPPSMFPQIEVYSPEGKYVIARRTMNGSVVGGKQRVAKHKRTVRPRRSMKMLKSFRKGQEMANQKAPPL